MMSLIPPPMAMPRGKLEWKRKDFWGSVHGDTSESLLFLNSLPEARQLEAKIVKPTSGIIIFYRE
jgi:hypothetical protein